MTGIQYHWNLFPIWSNFNPGDPNVLKKLILWLFYQLSHEVCIMIINWSDFIAQFNFNASGSYFTQFKNKLQCPRIELEILNLSLKIVLELRFSLTLFCKIFQKNINTFSLLDSKKIITSRQTFWDRKDFSKPFVEAAKKLFSSCFLARRANVQKSNDFPSEPWVCMSSRNFLRCLKTPS